MARVVLPAPPFWLMTETVFMPSRSHASMLACFAATMTSCLHAGKQIRDLLVPPGHAAGRGRDAAPRQLAGDPGVAGHARGPDLLDNRREVAGATIRPLCQRLAG